MCRGKKRKAKEKILQFVKRCLVLEATGSLRSQMIAHLSVGSVQGANAILQSVHGGEDGIRSKAGTKQLVNVTAKIPLIFLRQWFSTLSEHYDHMGFLKDTDTGHIHRDSTQIALA